MRTCDVCNTQAIGSELDCRVCETPLPPLTVPVLAVSNAASPRRWSGGWVALVAVLCLALGFSAGWLSDRFLISPTPGISLTPGASAAPEDATDPSVASGQCLDLAGYELVHSDVANLPSHVVDCSEATALTLVAAPDGCTTYCQSAEDAAGLSISFYEIPAVGRCFFAYKAESGRGSGWPSHFVPCYAVPDQWIVDSAPGIAAQLEANVSTLRLVTHIVTSVSSEKPTCADGEDLWPLEYRDPAEWVCVAEVKAQ